MQRSRYRKIYRPTVEGFALGDCTLHIPDPQPSFDSCPRFQPGKPALGCADYQGPFSAYPRIARCADYNPGTTCKEPCVVPTGPFDPNDSSTWEAAGLGVCIGRGGDVNAQCKCNGAMIKAGAAQICDTGPPKPGAPINYQGRRGSACAAYTIPATPGKCIKGPNTTDAFCNPICKNGFPCLPADRTKCINSGCKYVPDTPPSRWTAEQAAVYRKQCPQTCGLCPTLGACECLGPDGFSPSTVGSWAKANQNTGFDLKQVGVDDVKLTALPKCSLCIPDATGGDSKTNLLGNIYKDLPPGSYCSCSNGKNLGCCSGKCHLNNTNGDLYCGAADWWGYCERNADCVSGTCMTGANPFQPSLGYCWWYSKP